MTTRVRSRRREGVGAGGDVVDRGAVDQLEPPGEESLAGVGGFADDAVAGGGDHGRVAVGVDERELVEVVDSELLGWGGGGGTARRAAGGDDGQGGVENNDAGGEVGVPYDVPT